MPVRRIKKALFRENINRAVTRLARRRKLSALKTANPPQETKEAVNRWITNGKKDIQNEARKRKTGIKGLTRLLSDKKVTERLFRMKKFQATKIKK